MYLENSDLYYTIYRNRLLQRGHNREPCFYDIEEYERYLDEVSDEATSEKRWGR